MNFKLDKNCFSFLNLDDLDLDLDLDINKQKKEKTEKTIYYYQRKISITTNKDKYWNNKDKYWNNKNKDLTYILNLTVPQLIAIFYDEKTSLLRTKLKVTSVIQKENKSLLDEISGHYNAVLNSITSITVETKRTSKKEKVNLSLFKEELNKNNDSLIYVLNRNKFRLINNNLILESLYQSLFK